MISSHLLQFIRLQFPTRTDFDASVPAFVVNDICYIIGNLSELNELREQVRLDKALPRPIVPILINDHLCLTILPERWLSLSEDKFLVMKKELVIGKVNPTTVKSYKSTPYIIDNHCVSCQFGIGPCPKHIWNYAKSTV